MTPDKKKTYTRWKQLVNMSRSELQSFYDSKEGKEAGLKPKEASKQGIHYGRESARWILKMKATPVEDWTETMWKWAGRQISFISRMSKAKGELIDEKGNKTLHEADTVIVALELAPSDSNLAEELKDKGIGFKISLEFSVRLI